MKVGNTNIINVIQIQWKKTSKNEPGTKAHVGVNPVSLYLVAFLNRMNTTSQNTEYFHQARNKFYLTEVEILAHGLSVVETVIRRSRFDTGLL